jgi:serine/threonine-protein kinase HipA
VTLDSIALPHWPAFLLDLLPAGPARQRWLTLLEVANGPKADWPLLMHAGRAPVGNLRLAHAREWKPELVRGFLREEVLVHGGRFLEFMRRAQDVQFGTHNDSPYSAADTQGAAPKYLLTQDAGGLWWAEGTLPDKHCRAFWLVKYPRGESRLDRIVLKAEAPCLEIARAFGLHCGKALTWEDNCLLVPRFDRIVEGDRVRRLGLESLCSSLGVAEFGHSFGHEELCEAIATFSTNPQEDLLEYLGRDVVNLALGNTDNHARNTAFLKDGKAVRLSPVYDLAPMELDPEGILRSARWVGEAYLAPDWNQVVSFLERWVERDVFVRRLHELSGHVQSLRERDWGLPAEVVERCRSRWEPMAISLEAVR